MRFCTTHGFTPHHFSIEKSGAGFTLLELLVVMALLSVVSTVTVLVVNPAELLRQARDAERLDNFASIEKAIGLIQANDPSAPLGMDNRVYVSLPSDQADCSDLGLPDLPQVPVAWSYACASSDNYRKTDGNGWLPINFENLSGTSLFATLPIDPVNGVQDGYYYTYVHQNPFKLTAIMESDKHRTAMLTDGGVDYSVYEVGSAPGHDLANFARGLTGYWKFDEGSGTSPLESSGYDPNYSSVFVGSPSWSAGVLDGGLDFGGGDSVDVFSGLPNSNSDIVSLSAWVKFNVAPTAGAKYIISREDHWLGFVSQYFSFHIMDSGGGGAQISSWASITPGEWYHLAGQYDEAGGTGRFAKFFNGKKMVDSNTNHDAINHSWGANIGLGGASGVDAVIDEVRAYNRFLSDNEMQMLYDLVAP
jgi:prepilin-type N-terminal cleavage/methylation domain-containing protein